MNDKYVDIRALIQENDEAREQYEDANTALEEAVRARNREADPKPGEVWEIIATPRACPHEPIPAIMGEWEWHVAPFLAGGSSTLHPMLAYPLHRIIRHPGTPGDTE